MKKRTQKTIKEPINTQIELPTEVINELERLTPLLHKIKLPRTKEQVSRELEAVMNKAIGCTDTDGEEFKKLQEEFYQLFREHAPASGQDLEGDLNVPELSLDELLSNITEDNKHPEVDWGKPRGKELI